MSQIASQNYIKSQTDDFLVEIWDCIIILSKYDVRARSKIVLSLLALQ